MSLSSLNCKDSSSSSLNLPYIPDDLLLNCLARVSRSYYRTLSLVSKRFLSLLTSLELYETQRLLGCTESCLYVCLPFPPVSNSMRWFTLQIHEHNSRWFAPCLAPSRLENTKNVLVSGPPRNSGFGLIAVGYKIYMIGGCIDDAASSNVFFMDCRSHTWHKAPSMHIPRKFPLVSVLDGKIYVVEGDKPFDPFNLMEVFDPKTQKWDYVSSPGGKIRGTDVIERLYSEALHLYGDEWDMYYHSDSCCVIDNVLYCGNRMRTGNIEWFDLEGRTWRVLKGVANLNPYIKLVNNGGKIAVFWEEEFLNINVKKKKLSSHRKMMWCAEISLERRNKKEIRGKFEWRNVVFSIPKSCGVKFIAAIV